MPKMEERNPHCLILPYPRQGHINPMLQFAKRLKHKGIAITLIITTHLAKTTQLSPSAADVSLATISDGFDGGVPPDTPPDVILSRFEEHGRPTLKEAIRALEGSGRPVDCVVYDAFVPWGLEVAKEMGLAAAAFFTQSCAVDQIYQLVHKGDLRVPLVEEEEIWVPGLPPLEPRDMPSFISVYGSYPSVFEMVVHQFKGLERADWQFYNTFYKLEEEVINYMAKFSPVKAIGPSIPSMYLDKKLLDDTDYGLSVCKPVREACMDWLNKRQPASVIYVSFGSMAVLDEKQTKELAWGLKLSNKHFLWVVRSSEQTKLPQEITQDMLGKGLIVSWCSQLDVLSHAAICCFLTHCGWNSTLEALSLGVPMVAMPQWTDQSTNSKFVMDVWKMGIRAIGDDNGLVGRETIASSIREVLEGDRKEEIKKNAIKWKELAREAMDEGGSSDKNIDEFVTSLKF
ncbi:glycosyltransferase [Striga asiatica]|uniref:Glycosyltransferase n=1 Tax=Striga asiatica TaxID=4170 RepID=A0A5A7Q4J3_STRAF|nr:glycosyltransferase [Striga asiatica]